MILSQNLLDDRVRRHPARSSCQRLRPVADVDDRLRRRDADIGVGPEDAVADREHARLHGAAHFAGRRIVAEDRERSGVPERLMRLRLAGRRRLQRATTTRALQSLATRHSDFTLPTCESQQPPHPQTIITSTVFGFRSRRRRSARGRQPENCASQNRRPAVAHHAERQHVAGAESDCTAADPTAVTSDRNVLAFAHEPAGAERRSPRSRRRVWPSCRYVPHRLDIVEARRVAERVQRLRSPASPGRGRGLGIGWPNRSRLRARRD